MRSLSHAFPGLLIFALALPLQADTQTNVNLRVMAANTTSGNSQRYETPGLNIFKGLKPDIVAIQEFNVSNNIGINTTEAIRAMIDDTFGTNFVYFRESGYSIPNGVISRYPMIASGSWTDSDTGVNDRGFAWAQIDLPGTNDLYVVSVHLKASNTSSDISRRTAEANELTDLISTNFPTNAWIVVAGDFNLFSETEGAIIKFKTYLSDSPVPADQAGDQDTNAGRTERYDRVLPSFSFTNSLTNVVLISHTFSSGLVFDSRVYTPLSDVSPVASGDSGATGMQHMGVVKDFRITYTVTNGAIAPTITNQPQSLTVTQGNNATFTVGAAGTSPLSYQWRFSGTNISSATLSSYTRANAQSGDAGSYTVVVTNSAGSVTSSVVTLTVNVPPSISAQPTNLTVNQRDNATFTVIAAGAPLNYQWRFNAGNISGATTGSYTKTNAQPADIGSYSVVITNAAGSVTSSAATLSLNVPQPLLTIAMPNAISWLGLSNLSYTVQAKPDLNAATWATLGTTSAPTVIISFTNADDGTTQRYYRVVYP